MMDLYMCGQNQMKLIRLHRLSPDGFILQVYFDHKEGSSLL